MAATRSGGKSSGSFTVNLGQFGNLLAIFFLAVGLIIIAFGINGTRSTALVAEQVSFLLSGGILGLAFVIIGAALIIVQKGREDRASLEKRLESMLEVVISATGGDAAPRDVSGLVVAGSASFHIPGCRLVDGREEVTYLTPEEAVSRDLKPCRVCQPDVERTNVTVR